MMNLDTELIRGTFTLIVPISEEFSKKFYEYLWLDYPSSQVLFENTNMSAQRKALIGSLDFIVKNLDNEKTLIPYLHEMGVRHVDYGTRPEHYEIVGSSLLKTLKYFFKRLCDEEVINIWTQAYALITKIMLEGVTKRSGQKDVKLKNAC